MRERTRNIMVGVCTIGGLASLGALLFLFGEIEPLFTQRWTLKVAFNEAGGIRKGSLVTLNGVPVGSVDRVEFWSDPTQPVLVIAGIDEKVRIPEPSTPSIQTSLLGAGARLELTAALPLAVPARTYPRDTETILRGRVQPIEARVVEQLDEKLGPIVASFGELSKLARNLNSLVEPSPDGASPNPESLRTAMRRLNDTLASADEALRSAQTWLNDEQLRTDIRDAAHGASELMRDATVAASRIGSLADSLTADAAALRAGALPVLDRASASLQELERLMIAAREGNGTVGRLVRDPQLYEGLADAAKRLDESLAKLGLLLDKIRAEGLGVDFMSR
ncbi:MAG: hypothetical protein RL136_1703 [Planctomycetota bacterium]|jgi:phospholipid/cholesterol/gamma-HCH transport system substrate-binding protein